LADAGGQRRSGEGAAQREGVRVAGVAYSQVSAAVGVRGRCCGVRRGEGVQGRDWSGFCGSPAMLDLGEGGRSVRLGCVRASEMTHRGGCVRCAGAGKSCAGGARAAGSAVDVGGAGVSV
jgi:hypothetical protein